jgi:hypothetical protein
MRATVFAPEHRSGSTYEAVAARIAVVVDAIVTIIIGIGIIVIAGAIRVTWPVGRPSGADRGSGDQTSRDPGHDPEATAVEASTMASAVTASGESRGSCRQYSCQAGSSHHC